MTTHYIIKGFGTTSYKEEEMFLHSYNLDFIELDFGIAFVLLDQEVQFIVKKHDALGFDDINFNIYESIEMEEPEIINYSFSSSGAGDYDSSVIDFKLSTTESEIINYSKPIEFQLSINDEITSAENDYINSIPRKEIEFDILSSLGVIATEDAITESTTTGTSTEITSTTGVITDVGGPTATGTRTNILTDGTATRDVTIRSY
jgi:hypothetical protein